METQTCQHCRNNYDLSYNIPIVLPCDKNLCQVCIQHIKKRNKGLALCPFCDVDHTKQLMQYSQDSQIVGELEEDKKKKENIEKDLNQGKNQLVQINERMIQSKQVWEQCLNQIKAQLQNFQQDILDNIQKNVNQAFKNNQDEIIAKLEELKEVKKYNTIFQKLLNKEIQLEEVLKLDKFKGLKDFEQGEIQRLEKISKLTEQFFQILSRFGKTQSLQRGAYLMVDLSKDSVQNFENNDSEEFKIESLQQVKKIKQDYDILKEQMINLQMLSQNQEEEIKQLQLKLASENPNYQNIIDMNTPVIKQIQPRKALSSLIEECKHNANIKSVIEKLQKDYNSFRIVRGDGNCYFRAVGFSFLEHLSRFTTPVQHLQDFINKIESNQGYYQVRPNFQDNSHQDLNETFLKFLKKLEQKKRQNDKEIHTYLQKQMENNKHNQDEALVWQMRSLSANYLESHKDYFLSYCDVPYQQLIQEVLTMGREAEGLGIGPLQVVLKVKIQIVTIDRNYQEALQLDQMKIYGKCPIIYILFKPGHYDIIYTRDQSLVDGFDEASQKLKIQNQVPPNYKIENPDEPFFVEIQKSGQESPMEEFKPFQIVHHYNYVSTKETLERQKRKQIKWNQN